MTRDQLINCGRVMRALLTEFDADHLELGQQDGTTLLMQRGVGLDYESPGLPTLHVPEAAFEERWELAS